MFTRQRTGIFYNLLASLQPVTTDFLMLILPKKLTLNYWGTLGGCVVDPKSWAYSLGLWSNRAKVLDLLLGEFQKGSMMVGLKMGIPSSKVRSSRSTMVT